MAIWLTAEREIAAFDLRKVRARADRRTEGRFGRTGRYASATSL